MLSAVTTKPKKKNNGAVVFFILFHPTKFKMQLVSQEINPCTAKTFSPKMLC